MTCLHYRIFSIGTSRHDITQVHPRINIGLQYIRNTSEIHFNGVDKGNLGPNGYGGTIKNSKGDIISLLWGSIRNNTNNMVELEVLINGLKWAMQTGKIPLVAEGDSQIIINLARRLQSGALTTQVSKNWRWEGRLSVLRQILTSKEAILLLHVKWEGNKVEDVMENVGVENSLSFHAEEC